MRGRMKVGWLYRVKWLDINTGTSWQDRQTEGLAECQSVGWCVASLDDRISLVATRGQDEADHTDRETLQRITIPLGCVTQWERLDG